jgi:hypothetical protein
VRFVNVDTVRNQWELAVTLGERRMCEWKT